MKKNADNTWFVFNREYVPLGWNSKFNSESIDERPKPYKEYPIHTEYQDLTDEVLLQIIKRKELIHFDDNGRITTAFFYNDALNPTNANGNWEAYFEIIKALGHYQTYSNNARNNAR